MILSPIKYIFQFVVSSFAVWVLLSTCIPQVTLKYTDGQIQSALFRSLEYPYTSITSPPSVPLHNSTIYYIIAHPDDEVMFFLPSLLELSKPKYGNRLKLVCLSAGDSIASMAGIRTQELRQSARILGVADSDVFVGNFKDGMNETWSVEDISITLKSLAPIKPNTVFITFDENGVSGHPNHISLYYGVSKYLSKSLSRLYVLKSLSFWEKYSFTLLTNVELLFDQISYLIPKKLLKIGIKFSHGIQENSLRFYSDLNMLSVSYAAMAYGHFSQMVWFRYGWLLCSRYLTYNHLVEVSV